MTNADNITRDPEIRLLTVFGERLISDKLIPELSQNHQRMVSFPFLQCVCVCICVCAVCGCAHMCASQKLMSGVLLSCFPPYLLRQDLSLDPVQLDWWVREPLRSSRLPLLTYGTTGKHHHSLPFMSVLGT